MIRSHPSQTPPPPLRSEQPSARVGRVRSASSVVTLAWWRVRQTWELLLVAGLGMIAAVMIACTGPLYSDLAMTAGLRAVIAGAPQNESVIIQSTSEQISAQVVQQTTNEIQKIVQQYLGPYVGPLHLSYEAPLQKITMRNGQPLQPAIDELSLVSQPITLAASHLTLLQGHLPPALPPGQARALVTSSGARLAIALSQQEAAQLHVKVGDTLTIAFDYDLRGLTTGNGSHPFHHTRTLTLQVSGIFANQYHHVSLDQDPFWHQQNFVSVPHQGLGPAGTGADYTALADTQTLLTIFDRFYRQVSPSLLLSPLEQYWLYEFLPDHITSSSLAALVGGITSLQLAIANASLPSTTGSLVQTPFVESPTAYLPSDILSQYQSRIAVVRLPVVCMLVLIVFVILFFVSQIADLLVDRQHEAIVILRSRGLSRSQAFAIFATQGLVLGLLAAGAGSFCAVYTAHLLVSCLLPAGAEDVLALIAGNPFPSMWGMRWPALLTASSALMAMLLSMLRPLRSSVIHL
jgi:putative ABC transport system permease protein